MSVVSRSVMFHGQIERPFKAVHILTYSDKRVTVALNPHCLHILDSKSPPVSSHTPSAEKQRIHCPIMGNTHFPGPPFSYFSIRKGFCTTCTSDCCLL